MGQILMKQGSEEKRDNEIGPVLEECYEKYFVNTPADWDWTLANFYHAICLIVDDINTKIGSTQFRVPKSSTLERAYHKHHKGKGKELTKEEFQKILEEVVLDTGVTGIGVKDILFYIFGVPATALVFKQRIIPNLIPNEIFIPAVTSATVFLLARLNKI